MQVKTVRADKV